MQTLKPEDHAAQANANTQEAPIKEGYILKRKGGLLKATWKRQYAKLFPDRLEHAETYMGPYATIPLGEDVVCQAIGKRDGKHKTKGKKDIPFADRAFRLISRTTKKEIACFSASDIDQRDEWVMYVSSATGGDLTGASPSSKVEFEDMSIANPLMIQTEEGDILHGGDDASSALPPPENDGMAPRRRGRPGLQDLRRKWSASPLAQNPAEEDEIEREEDNTPPQSAPPPPLPPRAKSDTLVNEAGHSSLTAVANAPSPPSPNPRAENARKLPLPSRYANAEQEDEVVTKSFDASSTMRASAAILQATKTAFTLPLPTRSTDGVSATAESLRQSVRNDTPHQTPASAMSSVSSLSQLNDQKHAFTTSHQSAATALYDDNVIRSSLTGRNTAALVDALQSLSLSSQSLHPRKLASLSRSHRLDAHSFGEPTFDPEFDEWNERYQSLIDLPEDTFEQSMQKGIELARFLGTFLAAARAYATTIVDEYHLPTALKTIPPALFDTDELHPADREEVYIHRGLLLRFAIDARGELDDIAAFKVAGNELRGTKAYLEACAPALSTFGDDGQPLSTSATPPTGGLRSHRLHTPLSCLVDYKGMRVVVIGIFPANGSDTLVFGISKDSSHMDKTARRLLESAAARLNLAEHAVFDRPGHSVSLATSSAVQVHRCDDDRLYLINLSRAMPPDAPAVATPQVLTHLLRPEFVRNYHTRLSPDAFGNIGAITDEEKQTYAVPFDIEAARASSHLRDVILPAFVHQLDLVEVLPANAAELEEALHRAGINMRYLGVVAKTTKLPYIRDLCVVDMIARTCKDILCKSLRKLLGRFRADPPVSTRGDTTPDGDPPKTPSSVDEAVVQCVVDFFNLILGVSNECERYWTAVLTREVAYKFGESAAPLVSYRTACRAALFLAMQHHTAVRFADDDRQAYPFGESSHPISRKHLIAIEPKQKFAINELMECFVLAAKWREYEEIRAYEKAHQALNLRLTLHQSLHGMLNPAAGVILGDLCGLHTKMGNFDLAVLCGCAALGVCRKFAPETVRLYGNLIECLYRKGDAERAIECYNHAIQIAVYHYGPHHPLLLSVHDIMGHMYLTVPVRRPITEQQSAESRERRVTLGVLIDNDGSSANAASSLSTTPTVDVGAALDCFGKSLELATKSLGTNHPVTANYCLRLAHIFRKERDYEAAVALYERALMIYRTILGPEAVTTTHSYFYLCETLSAKGDMSRALEYGTKALRIREKLLGPSHPLTLNSLYQVAVAADTIDDVPTALLCYEKLLAYLKTAPAESALNDIQEVTRAMVRLRFRNLPQHQQIVLQRSRLQAAAVGPQPDYRVRKAITSLYERSPIEYVDELLTRALHMDDEAALELGCVEQLIEDQIVFLSPSNKAPEM